MEREGRIHELCLKYNLNQQSTVRENLAVCNTVIYLLV